MTYSFSAKLKCLQRELAIRRNVYPKRMRMGSMRAESADSEIAMLEEIIDDYKRYIDANKFPLD